MSKASRIARVLTRRHIRLVIALLLPLMALRAMLPAGFMPVAEHGKLRMVMCSAGLALPATTGSDSGSTTPDHSDTGNCPFAHAAVSAPITLQVIAIVEPLRVVRFIALDSSDLPPATGPPRLTAARGPPALSI